MPGKADVKKTIREYQKADKNTDGLYGNLNMKFIAECPTIKFLRATFCRMRPIHILTTSYISRSTRLCTKHQNMTLLLKQTANPETFAMERIATKQVVQSCCIFAVEKNTNKRTRAEKNCYPYHRK